MKVRVPGVRKLRNILERRHPLFALGQGHTSSNHVFLMRRPSTFLLEEEEIHERTETPVACPQRGARPQQFIIVDDEAELELSLGSRSFLDRVNDQVRQNKTIFDDCDRTTKSIL